MKLLLALTLVVLLVSVILSSFLSLEYPQATYVDLKQRIADLSFNYAYSLSKFLDFLGLWRLPLFYRWFFKTTRQHERSPGENSYDTKINNVPVTVFKPTAYASKKLLPGIIYIHGGGFVLPTQEAHYEFCSMLATNISAIVFLVHNRVSPEHPFPAPLDDVRDVVDHVLWNPEQYGVRPNRIALGGDDTGAALALSTAIELVNADPSTTRIPPNKLYMIYLVSPVLQIANLALPSYVTSKNYIRGVHPTEALSFYSGIEKPSKRLLEAIQDNLHIPFTMKIRFQPLLDFNLLNETFIPEEYVAPDLALDLSPDVPEKVTWLASNAEAFPMLYENSYLQKLPVTYIQACEYSMARDDGLIFAKRLEKEAGSLKLAVIRSAMHNDPVLRSPVFAEASRDLIRFLRKTLYKQSF